MNNDRFNLKLILVGEASVGKTSIVQRYLHNSYEPHSSPTIGAAYETKSIEIGSCQIDVNIWDTAGQESYRSLLPMFYRAASIVFIVFDITNRKSFTCVPHWLEDVNNYVDKDKEIVFALCANKVDIGYELPKPENSNDSKHFYDGNNENLREVSSEEIQEMAQNLKIPFFETSALTGSGIAQAFESTLSDYVKRHEREINMLKSAPSRQLVPNTGEANISRRCCKF